LVVDAVKLLDDREELLSSVEVRKADQVELQEDVAIE
jgi:hypothetical protein